MARGRKRFLRMAAFIMTALLVGLGRASPMWAAEEQTNEAPSVRYDARGRRDPFVPLVRDGRLIGAVAGSHMQSAKPTLYGILWDPGGRSIALINDVEARVGDTVDGYQVVDIRQDAVVLSSGGEEVVLEISFEAPPEAVPDTTKRREGR